jgi:hypothetical protein
MDEKYSKDIMILEKMEVLKMKKLNKQKKHTVKSTVNRWKYAEGKVLGIKDKSKDIYIFIFAIFR